MARSPSRMSHCLDLPLCRIRLGAFSNHKHGSKVRVNIISAMHLLIYGIAMSESEQSLLQDIAIGRAPRDVDDEQDTQMNYEGVINGEEQLMISNAGGELEALRTSGDIGQEQAVYQLGGGFYKL